MKPQFIKPLLLVSAMLMPVLQAQETSENIRGIERKVLLKQRQEAVRDVIGAARGTSGSGAADTRDVVGKRLQWLSLVNNRIGQNGQTTDAENAEAARSASAINDMAWSLIIAPDASACRPETALKLVDFAIDLGGHDATLKPKMRDTRARALFVMGRNAEAIAEQVKAISGIPAGEEKAGFEATLDSYQRNELPQVAQPPLVDDPSSGVQYLTGKLRTIVIPAVDFEDVSLEEAVDYLRKQAVGLDVAELDPGRKGVNFVIRRPRSIPVSEAGPGAANQPEETDLGSLRVKELRLRNVPLAVALKYVCEVTRCRYKVDDFAVTLVPQDGPEEIFTRTFRVPRDFVTQLDSGIGKPPSSDPAARRPLVDTLRDHGIVFGEGTSATLSASGVLLVTNTPTELDKVEQLVSVMLEFGR